MFEKYFEKFPITNYSNTNVVDITKRSVLLNLVYDNPFAFYPYEISSNERADQLSFRYYDDPYQSWILYLSNKIVDPYYEWYLHDSEFNEYISSKYGSYENAVNKIKHYSNDWIGKENISVSYYDALTPNLKKYWNPVYGIQNIITSYERFQYDWIVNTNKIISYGVTTTSNFITDEICNITFNGGSAKGQLLSSTNTAIYLHHVSGNYVFSNVGYITGSESGSNVAFSSASIINANITDEEAIYWKPISYFEYETQNNEYNKTLRIIDKAYKQKLSDNLKTVMNE